MELNERLYKLFEDKAGKARVDIVSLGLGYTAVTISDGGIGVAYTYFDRKASCCVSPHTYVDYEGLPAVELLERIRSGDPIKRSMALALINALNYENALLLPETIENEELFDRFGIGEGTRVAMVGAFGPIIKICRERGATLELIDIYRGLGSKEGFYEKLREWAQVLFLTSTSILNSTTEEVLEYVGPQVKSIMLGPSTPMVGEAFGHLPVHRLAGTVPLQKERVLKAIRHGTGTPVILKFSRKAHLDLQPDQVH
jgi:uncharacterized protein (DUF4213/DUF364 family)